MEINAPAFHEAVYIEQRIPQFIGNPFIEALPELAGEENILKELLNLPYFDPAQREWADHERFQMIIQLANFTLPFERHIQLAYSVHSMMRQGYVGREPHSASSSEIFKKLHDKTLLNPQSNVTPQISSALIGPSGMGKTSTLKRVLRCIPQVIHHPKYGIYQLPYLHIGTPHDGASVTSLAHSIFRKVDILLPGADYSEQYRSGGSATLMNHAARILRMHHTGLLIMDEINNLANSRSNREGLMDLLVSASNELGTPILFVGTSKARNVLSLSASQARRSVGFGVPMWERLEKGEFGDQGDWDIFSRTLLRYQWVRKPGEPTQYLTDLLYELSQGIIDFAIKLFGTAQCRAIMDGSETITGQLLLSVAERELGMVEPIVDALRRNDFRALDKFDDIASVSLEQLIAQTRTSYAGRLVRGVTVGPTSEGYGQMLKNALSSIGFEASAADVLTTESVHAGAKNALDGLEKAIKFARSGPKRVKCSEAKNSAPPAPSYDPGDYRNALITSNGVLESLDELRMLPDMNALFAC